MRRMPITYRITSFNSTRCHAKCYGVLGQISLGYPPVSGRLHTCYSPVRRSPSGGIATAYAAPRLACVKPVASVHPEPGSNSSLLIYLIFIRSRFVLVEKNASPRFNGAARYILYKVWNRLGAASSRPRLDRIYASCILTCKRISTGTIFLTLVLQLLYRIILTIVSQTFQ